MEYFKKIIKESIIVIIITSIIGMFTGSFLSLNISILYAFPILLLMLPSLNSLIGDIATILVSRLTSHLYIGTIVPKFERSERLMKDFIGLIITILLSVLSLIIIGYGIGLASGVKIANPFTIALILFMTVVLIFMILFVALFISSIIIFRKGKDPNNFLIPFTTSLVDFLTPLSLIIFIQIFI